MVSEKKIMLFSICLFVFSSALINVGHGALSDEAQGCLGCHAKPGIRKSFENKESIAADIDAGKFEASVHSSLTCSDCHTDFSADMHPDRRFRDKKQYKIRASHTCRRCHKDEQIAQKSIHASLLGAGSEVSAPICTDCHDAHAVRPVMGGKKFTTEKQYCMNCHRYSLSMSFKSGETLLLRTDIFSLEGSVHNKLGCSDCHFGFSSEEHPKRNFRTKRDYVIASSESCRRCHFDKYTKTMESIHFAMLSQGNLNAPMCIDCHGSHAIPHIGKEKKIIARRCEKCHPEIYNIYAKSIHGKALFNEDNQDVPVCIDCHTAHNIENPLTSDYREKIPEICSNCHADKAVMDKYGISTEVVKTYLSDFHGITLSFYRKQKEGVVNRYSRQIAVCTDCHGTHNISSVIGRDSTIIKANLTKRCQKCHEGAGENFQDAWLSHYKPSLTKAPLVFIVNLAYKIFIPFMVVGLILQILLHIWRYAVTR